MLILLFPVMAMGQLTEIKYLSGTGSDHTVPWQFFCTGGLNANKWTTIAVPSCWELQGFGKYDYGFAKDSIRGKEKGMYKYEFEVAPAWKNKQVNIVFEGVMTDAEVKVNGQSAGTIHQGAFYSFKYDISNLLKYDGKNLLEVTVAKHSANQSVNEAERKADFWIFGGIFRPVFLEALPLTHIENVQIDARASRSFSLTFSVKGKFNFATVQITDANGAILGRAKSIDFSDSWVPPHIIEKFPLAKLWTPESPSLYQAVVTIYKNGRPLHTTTQKFGFRTVELKQRDGIYVNGVKVKMKGINRSPFRPESGRTSSKENSIEDVLLIKDMNMNAVRCSHYPPDDHFLDACDSMGLFVMDELAGWHGHYDTPTGSKLVKEMVDHDQNHPSIIMWSNGNEGGHNFDLDSLFDELDFQSRPVIHPWSLFNGIETQHYREYNYGIGNYENGREILMPTEFLHGQFDGGHGAGLEDYWEKMWTNPLSAGGFLWDFADQAVVRKDLHDSLDTDKFRAADGILGPHHEKEGSYFAIKEIWSPVHFEKKEITADFDGSFNIENRYFFTNTNQCAFSYRFAINTKPTDPGKSGNIIAPSIKPGEKGIVKLTLPANWKDYYTLYITVQDKTGRIICLKSYPIIHPAVLTKNLTADLGKPAPGITETDSFYNVKANGIELGFHRRTGLLKLVRNATGILPFSNGPIIQEGVNNFGSFTARVDGKNIVIESAFDRKKNYNTLQWTIYPAGLVKMQVNYFPAEYFTSFVGVNFSLPEPEIVSVDWLGDGPYRVWKNRMKGTQFGLWHKDYNATETGETWIYPEFKGYYSKMYWCKFNTITQPFTVYTETEDLFLRLYSPAWKTDQWHNYEPIFPSGDISFMQGISSIGTKTQRNETTGPMGMKNIFYDYEKDPGRALKMVLYFDFSGK